MSTPVETDLAAPHKDRRVGCVVLGVLEILMGALSALMGLLIGAMTVVASRASLGLDARSMLPGIVFYVVLAVAFVWLGVGSILCRRWARTLLLFVAWSGLVAGVMSLGFLALLLPRMMENLPSGPPVWIAVVVTVGTVGLFFVALPATMILFYQSRNVVATFEARDPKRRWTDACPMPVLATALWFAYGAIFLAMMPLLYRGVFPAFGVLLSGPVATVLSLLLAGVWLWLAWAFYRLQVVGLWVSIALTVVGFASTCVTFARVDFLEMYRLMGYPEQQIAQIEQLGIYQGPFMVWTMALLGLATVAFLLWLRRYFPSAPTATSAYR
jgi:hypothetical protein